jgi:hypothetical protein
VKQSSSIQWTRTTLEPREREALLCALTPEQKAQLREHDYAFVAGTGVLWKPPDGGALRRARFTHGTHFRTLFGEFYIDSEGSARALESGAATSRAIAPEGQPWK